MNKQCKFRHEYKFYINEFDKTALIHSLSAVMKPDAFTQIGGKYRVRSLYFDNFDDKVLREKLDGISVRDKLRIRYYNDNTDFIRFEKKSKVNGLCLKSGFKISKEECASILNGDYSSLKSKDRAEYLSLINSNVLRPRIIVDYDREALTFAPGNVRVTFDSHIKRSVNTNMFLDPDYKLSPVSRSIILEVKYDEFLPQIIRDMIQLKYRAPTAYSKYSSSRLFD